MTAKPAYSVVAVACMGAALVLVLGGCSAPVVALPRLENATTPFGVCTFGSSSSDWAKRRTDPSEFAVLELTVKGSEPLTVDSVSLIKPTGVKLTQASFVPGLFGVSQGGYSSNTVGRHPADWSRRLTMPGAVLTPAMSQTWEGVVGVVPTTATGGQAAGVILSYHVGDRQFSVTAPTGVAVYQNQQNCPS